VKKLKRSPYLDSAPLAMLPSTGSDNRLRRPTAFAQCRHVAVIHGQFGKCLFDRDCVVGLGGLEPPTKRIPMRFRLDA